MKPTTSKAGAFIRARRLQLGLSQLQVAIFIGVSDSTMSLFETGHKSISVRYADKLAEKLQCDVEELKVLIGGRIRKRRRIGHNFNGHKPARTKLGRFVRKLRIKLDLSQYELATLVNVRNNIISQIELGTIKSPNAELLVKLAEVLHCELSDLKKRLPLKPEPQPKTKLGRFIRSRRKELGLSLRDLGQKMGITEHGIYWREISNNCTIRYETARRLAGALEVEIKTLSQFIIARGVTITEDDFGKTVRLRRRQLGLSLNDLAQKVGVTKQSISLIELGRTQPDRMNQTTYKKICDLLDIEMVVSIISAA